MRSGIVCSGVSCLDLFLFGTDPLKTRESLSMVQRTQYRQGGATSNTGRALTRLGIAVEFMTVIGNDANGDIMMKLWQEDGIDTRYVTRTDAAGTALSTIPVYGDGKRGVYFCPGTNDIMSMENTFGENQAYLPLLRERQIFHFGYPPLMRQLQGKALAELLTAVRDTGVMVTLDTTPIADDSTLHDMLAASFRVAHLFTPNIEEASQATGYFSRLVHRAEEESRKQGKHIDIEAVIHPEELQAIGAALLHEGLPMAAITLGPNGAYICSGDEAALRQVPLAPDDLSEWANQQIFVPAFQVDGPVNTTGAGDTFTAGLLAGFSRRHHSLREIAQLAHATGALAVDMSREPMTYEEVAQLMPTMIPRPPSNPLLQEMAGIF